MGIHAFTKINQNGVKIPSETERYKKYREIYVLLRQLKLSHKLADLNLSYIILDMNQTYDIHDCTTKINTSWYRCPECNKALRKDKQRGTRFCSSRSCSLYRVHFDKEGKRDVEGKN